jgi:hypothetical protein
MYILLSDILTQYARTKMDFSFLSPQLDISMAEERFHRDSRTEEYIIFYLESMFLLLIRTIITDLS